VINAREEFGSSSFGDRRLDRRLEKIVTDLGRDPSQSFPDAAGGDAALEATYRFLANDAVTAAAILAPHIAATVKRASHCKCVIVAHDTTEFRFGDREGMGYLSGEGSEGFLAHVSLAIEPGALRMPIGLLARRTWARTTPRPKRATRSKRTDHMPPSERESRRWIEQVEASEQQATVPLIHVMDSEADAYPLLCQLVERKSRFVIRLHANRRVVDDDAKRLDEKLAVLPARLRRDVPLSARTPSQAARGKKRNTARAGRLAELEVACSRVTLKAPERTDAAFPETVTLSVVHVYEVSAPEGEDRVDWKLATTEPIETMADIETILDTYRARWVIEEYFKAIKTGCAFEKRQLESYDAIIKALSIFCPIAYEMLRLRTLARQDDPRPAREALRASLWTILRHHRQLRLTDEATVRDALMAIAQLGGHIKNNGWPGWIVLCRGYEKLLAMEEGALIAREICDQS
jgi:hypothetical protein